LLFERAYGTGNKQPRYACVAPSFDRALVMDARTGGRARFKPALAGARDLREISMTFRTCVLSAALLAFAAAAPALAQSPSAPAKSATTQSSSSTMDSAKETANKAAETANKAAEDVSKWTKKQWDAAKLKWSKEKSKWNSCEQQANAKNLTGKANWQFHYDCMTNG
jgi:hypothetical protein